MAKHTHKLRRVRYNSGRTMYFCVLTDCSFKINPMLAFGKRSICWRCGEEFIMGEYTLKLAKPHCGDCHSPRKAQTTPEVTPVTPILSLSDRLSEILEQVHITGKSEPEGEL